MASFSSFSQLIKLIADKEEINTNQLNQLEQQEIKTATNSAFISGQKDIVKILTEKASYDLKQTPNNVSTQLNFASFNGHKEIEGIERTLYDTELDWFLTVLDSVVESNSSLKWNLF